MNEAVTVVPLFRSDTQFKVLGELYTQPWTEMTVGELAERTGVPRPSVSRELGRLVQSGLLRTRREGNRTLVRANHSASIADDLRSLLAKVYGPAAAIREALAAIPGVERAVVFGSWAARWAGEPGPVPNDIDVLVIGDVAADEVWTAAARLSRTLGLPVTPVTRTPGEWDADRTGFAANVRSGPQVDVTPARDPEAR